MFLQLLFLLIAFQNKRFLEPIKHLNYALHSGFKEVIHQLVVKYTVYKAQNPITD